MSLDDSRPPQKRQRIDVDEIEQHASSSFTRSKFWFDDGNIVLQTEDMQFRLHRSILSFHSSVFKDMFDMPQPADSEQAVDGCPVVTLSDSSHDLEIVLSVLFDNGGIRGMFKQLPFANVAAMLRLGTKYEIDYMRQGALDMLHHDFTTSLADWDALNGHTFNTDIVFIMMNDGSVPNVNLMLEFSLCTALPSAYLLTLIFVNLDELIRFSSKFPEVCFTCIKGREKILFWLNSLHLSWSKKVTASSFSPECRRPSRCTSTDRRTVLDNFPLWPASDVQTLAIFWFDEYDSPGNLDITLCTMCIKALENVHKDIRIQTWAALPTFFGLLPWEDLKDQ